MCASPRANGRGNGLCRGKTPPRGMQDVACRMGNLPITTPRPRAALGCAGDASCSAGPARHLIRCVAWRVGWAICPSRRHNHAGPWVVPGMLPSTWVMADASRGTSGYAWRGRADGQSAQPDATTTRGLGLCRGWLLQCGRRKWWGMTTHPGMRGLRGRMGNLPITTPQPCGALGCAVDGTCSAGGGSGGV